MLLLFRFVLLTLTCLVLVLIPEVSSRNVVGNPSFESVSDWRLRERLHMWIVKAADPLCMNIEQGPSHSGSRSLHLGPIVGGKDSVFATQYIPEVNIHDERSLLKVVFWARRGNGSDDGGKDKEGLKKDQRENRNDGELKHAQTQGKDEKGQLTVHVDVLYRDSSHLMAVFPVTKHLDIEASTPDAADSGFVRTCHVIPSYGEIRALGVHITLDRESKEPAYIDDITIDEVDVVSDDDNCSLYTEIFPKQRNVMVNFLAPTAPFTNQSITLATQMTYDRFPNLAAIAKVWNGPISVALLLLREGIQSIKQLTQELVHKYYASKFLHQNVAIHLILEDDLNEQDSTQYPVNFLRNVALKFGRTSHVFLVDTDISPGFSERQAWKWMDEAKVEFRSEENDNCLRCAFISPVFDVKTRDAVMPASKKELLAKLKEEKDKFEKYMGSSHNMVKYGKWHAENKAYRVFHSEHQEPYFIVPRDAPLMNDLFEGYGRDKTVYINELEQLRYTFVVLAESFLLNRRDNVMGLKTIWNRSGGLDLRSFLSTELHWRDMLDGNFSTTRENFLPQQKEVVVVTNQTCCLSSENAVSEEATNSMKQVTDEAINSQKKATEATQSKKHVTKKDTNSEKQATDKATNSEKQITKEATNSEQITEEATNSDKQITEEASNSEKQMNEEATNSEKQVTEEATNSEKQMTEEATTCEEQMNEEATNSEKQATEEATNSEQHGTEAINSKKLATEEPTSSKKNVSEEATERVVEKDQVDGGANCNVEILQNIDLCPYGYMKLRKDQLIQILMHEFRIGLFIEYPKPLVKSPMWPMMNPDAIITLIPNDDVERYSVNGIFQVFTSPHNVSVMLEVVRKHHMGPVIISVNTKQVEELMTQKLREYIFAALSSATDRDIVLFQGYYPSLGDLQKQMCELHLDWKIIHKSGSDIYIMKPTALVSPHPRDSVVPPPLVLATEPPVCDPLYTKVDVILMTRNRPLQTYAFLDSLREFVLNVHKIWVLYRADEDLFKDGYDRAISCASRLLPIEGIKDSPGEFGSKILDIVQRSVAQYFVLGVDELIWLRHVDLQYCACLLKKGDGAFHTFQLRLGQNMGHYPSDQDTLDKRFFPMAHNSSVLAYYPLRLKGDFGYVLNVDGTMVSKTDFLEDLEDKIKTFEGPSNIEGAWMHFKLHVRSKQWHLMSTHSNVLNNNMNDGRMADHKKKTLSEQAYENAEKFLNDKQKIDILRFSAMNEDPYTVHRHGEVMYVDTDC